MFCKLDVLKYITHLLFSILKAMVTPLRSEY